MARGFFGRRRGNGADETSPDWPELPGSAEQPPAQALDAQALDAQDPDVPALAYVQAIASAVPAPVSDPPEAAAQSALVRHIAACRGAVADTLYESSRDYRVLCDLVHENLPERSRSCAAGSAATCTMRSSPSSTRPTRWPRRGLAPGQAAPARRASRSALVS